MTEEELRASMGATVAQPGVLAEPEAPAVDPLRASMGAFVDRNQESLGRLRASAFQAAQTTPQKEAQKKYLSEVTGLPPAVVQTNEGEAKARARFEELRALSEQSPILRERLFNPEFAKLVEPKDVEKLSTAEQIFRGFGEYVLRPIGGDAVSMVGKGASGLFAAPFDAAAWATQPLVGKLLPANPFGQVGDFFRQQGAKWKNWAETYGTAAGDYPDVARRSIAQGVASAYNSLLTMPASAALQGAQQLARAGSMLTPSIRALLPIGAQTGGAEYIDAAQAGLSFPRALSYAGLQAGAEMTTEALPTGELLSMLKGSSSFLKSAGRFFAQEVVGEQIATAWQDFNNWVYLHPEKTVKDYLDERPQAALQTLIATVVAGGLQAGAVGLVRRSQQRAQDIAQTNDEIGKLQELMRIASGTQVRELDKANFAEFVQAAADSAPNAPKSVFIDGRVLVDTLAQSGITETELSELLPSVPAQLANAVATKRAVEIPIGEALASLPGTPLEKALLPDLRTREDGLSLNEAKDAQKRAQEFLAQDANRVIQAAADTAQAIASQEAVYQRVRADYDATGRFTPEVREKGARLVAQFYSVMGARTGMRADQLYEMLPYRVRGQGPTGESTLSRQLQAKTQRDFTTAEREYNTLEESAGGVILDTDLARELSPEYRADRSRAAEVHEAASAFIKQLYAAKLARPTPPGKAPYVLFTAGGTGAGKSSAMALLPEVVEGAEIVYDGAMAKLESAVQKIEQALAAGREVRMVYVYRDPVEALAGGALPRAMATGRTAPLSALYETHTGSRRVLGELMARYAGDPRVEFVAVDNSRGAGNAAVVAFDAVPQVSDNGLQEKLNETLEAEFQAGRISETIYRAFQGAPSPAGSGAGSSLRASDQQSGVGGQEVLEQAARVVTGRPLFEDIISAVGLTDAEFASTAIQWMTGLPDDMAFLPPTVYVDSEGGEVQTDGLPNTVAFLHARRLESGLPVLDIKNPEDRATLAKMVAAEALASIRVAGSSLEWYDQTVQTTLALMAVKYPEVKTDPRARTAFLLAVAITSQTMNVEDNLNFASEQYEAFRATVDSDGIGQFPEVGKGKSLEAMANNFKKVNTLLREMGPENLQRFLITPYTAKELNGFGFNIDENVDELVLGSAVLGPKIGFGFFSNLNGNFEPVTMDMWFMRTIGRLIGALPSFKPETFALQLRKFRSGLDERGDNGVFADRFDQALVERARTDDGAAIELARLVFKAHEKDFKDRRTDYDSGARAKSTIVKAADTMIKSLDKPKDIPANGTERQNLRDVVRQAVALVEQHHGARIPPAALQALIWYPEQELYKALGVKLRVTSQDYAGAAGKLLRSEGIDEDQIAAAIQSTQSGPGQVRSGASAANTGAAGGQPQALGGLGAFQGDERIRAYLERNQRLLELRAQSNAAEAGNRDTLAQSYAGNGGRDRGVGRQDLPAYGPAGVSGAVRARGVHYSQARRQSLDSSRYGTGARGAEASRLNDPSADPRIRQRVYFYLDEGAGVVPETGVGFYAHEVELDGLYDGQADPMGLAAGKTFNEFEAAVLDAGFIGYVAPFGTGRAAVLLGEHSVPVQYAGMGARPAQESQDGRRLQQAGDGGGRDSSGSLAPLEGAPVIQGATGPDPALVAVAEQYAEANGIPLRRQGEYVQVDPERGARIAAAYDAMPHAPQDPAVREAYADLIRQTRAQYDALIAAGYQFTFFDGNTDPYQGNPWNAMRDLRQNKRMAVYGTYDGYGTEGITGAAIEDNPMLADTGLRWPDQNGVERPVTANDLFRAVHDAFGHGLEGAGFRAQGEENAWQAHVRLFTGPAVAAITSETRGQNSWLNFGPYGETNRNAKLEGTVFAEQKTGLMPEWTWTEGRAPDMPADQLEQPARGGYDIGTMTTVLNGTADLSTFLHESGHFFLDALRRMVASGKATPEVAQMYQGALKALGVSEADWEKWHADYDATGKISAGLRRAHEKWADTFELYLFTGKAPSPEMRSLFRSFKEFLKRVYKSMQAFSARTGATLDPDLKAVMDRMLATDEQIAEAEQIAGMLPDLDATGEAQEKLDARSLRDLQWAVNARNKMIAKLQKEAAKKRKEVEAEVRAEVEQMPIYRAEMLLRYGRLPEGKQTNAQRKAMDSLAGMKMKLGLPQLKEMYGEDPAAPWRYLPLGKNGLAAAEGVHPDVLADGLGFPSGDALVRGLLAAEPIDSVVEGITDQRMLERYGDLASPEAIADAATEAVHNEARARSLATELSAQAEMLNPRRDTGQTNARGARVTVNALVEAAKTFADTVIGRTKIGHLKRTRWSHIQAERRAAADWQRATARGATQEAVQAKQDQMLNNAAVRAAQAAQERVSKAQELFRRVTRGSAENLVERGYDPDIVNAARAILAAYGIAESKGKTAAEYLEVLKRADPTTYAAVEPSLTAALFDAKPYEELTVDEFEALRDEVEALWHLARRSRQMEVDGDLLDREDVQEELKEDLEARGIPDTVPGEKSAITPAEQALRTLTTFRAALTRVESWAQNMGGRFTKYVFQPVKEAADRYRAARTDHLKRYRALLDTVAPTMRRQIIEAPELGYTFGKDTGGVAMGEILHAILHTGNSSNKRKLLLGRGWASENQDGTLDTTRWDGFVTRLINEGVLTKTHFDFAQGVWDLLESMKPLAQKTHRDVFGRYFAEVTAEPISVTFPSVNRQTVNGVTTTTQGGGQTVTYRGGYVPAIADTRIVPDADVRKLAEAENESLAFAFPATNRGFTKARVDYNRPLLLDLRLLAQHMDKVLLFSHLEQPVRDARRVLTSNTVSYGLNRIDPTAIGNVLTPWLNRAARQQVETPVPGDAGLMRLFSATRNRAGMAAMFANVANAAQQLTGFSIAAVRVRPTHLLSAAAEMMAHPKRTKEAVANASVYMRERMENETSNAEMAIKEILLDPSVYDRAKAWSARHAYFLQQAVDNSMGPIIWTGAYNQAIEDGQSQKDAVRFADSVIRTTQGSTLPEDVSRIETGNAFVRMFTQFSGYFNMQANLLGTEFAEAARELGVKKGAGRMLYVALLGFLAPAWVAEAIMQAFRGGPDDEDKDGEYLDDWLAAVLGWAPVRNATAMIPGVGQVINSAVNAANSKPYDDRIASSPAISMIESAVRSPASVYKAIVEEGSAQKAVRDVATLISMGTGVPASALARPLGYAAGMAMDDISPTSAADAGRGLLTGVASPESR